MGVKNRRDSHGSFLVVSFTASVTLWLLFALPNKQTPCKVICRFTKRAKRSFLCPGYPQFLPLFTKSNRPQRGPQKKCCEGDYLVHVSEYLKKAEGGEGNAEWKNLKRRAVSFG